MSKKNGDKKTATQAKQEYTARVDELARETFGWAKMQGCYRDHSDNEVQGYFVITRSSKKNSKPVWTEAFGEDREVWPDVLLRMLQLGFPICAESFNGHYIGHDGEQGVKIATTINNVYTRAETARKMAQYFIEARVWSESLPFIQKRLAEPLKETDPLKLLQALDQLFLGAGMPVQISIAQYLLTMGNDDTAVNS